ncbi:hypothetical protein BSPLISOX_1589 [uncultured Gammaproteobacteria bacterium]|jgi:hypothetical protein|nr:hypothetical protein [uncultured Gammaproteobacteria bacterium]VVH65372.1 hypothetical protein BSPLISOX_1589 [uncultured Gammaproteobacteria bacterium]
MHANTNEDGFVKKMTYTPSNVYDSQEFDKLLNINKTQEQYEGKLKPMDKSTLIVLTPIKRMTRSSETK